VQVVTSKSSTIELGLSLASSWRTAMGTVTAYQRPSGHFRYGIRALNCM
jgi:hypothetical protein